MTRIIPLTQGKVAIIDDIDYGWLSKHKRYCFKTARGKFYAARSTFTIGVKKMHYLHREIWEYHYGPIPINLEIDHINGDRLDNRLENLRLCTHSENMRNVRKVTPHSSRYKGVRIHEDGSYESYIRLDGKFKHLGMFNNEEEAAYCTNQAYIIRDGKFARLNII